MAGLIKREVIDTLRDRADIKAVVEGYVSLKPAGIQSFKGLCPFHDERTPSFHVRTSTNTYHCFGCGEGGDVISFIQKQDHATFTEAVERLAGMFGVEIEYEDGGRGQKPEEAGKRRRLLDAHKVAEEYYEKQLRGEEALIARTFLHERGFGPLDAATFHVGYSPSGWDGLFKHLTGQGFTREELVEAGLVAQGQRGFYDRFRGRLMFPIHDITGATIGFGARKLREDDQGPKYLNTSETPLYKKSQVLYGLDLAKKRISAEREVVVVEGYTDVMAAHLAGVGTAVATCGTAFGSGHIAVARRLLRDDDGAGRVIFTFDGDEAGQKAALRAFEEDHRFVSQTFVAVEPGGMDPCELRLAKGDEGVQQLIASRTPLFEFAIRSMIRGFDLATAEGRVGALRKAAPMVAEIRDPALRPEYTRQLSGWLGMDFASVEQAVLRAGENQGAQRQGARGSRSGETGAPKLQLVSAESAAGENAVPPGSRTDGAAAAEAPAPLGPVVLDVRDPIVRLERDVLAVAIQLPRLLSGATWSQFVRFKPYTSELSHIHVAVLMAAKQRIPQSRWVAGVGDSCPPALRNLVFELAALPLPARDEESALGYGRELLSRLEEMNITRQKSDLVNELTRLGSDDVERSRQIQKRLLELEAERRRHLKD